MPLARTKPYMKGKIIMSDDNRTLVSQRISKLIEERKAMQAEIKRQIEEMRKLRDMLKKGK
jgi:hypothetical protein